MLAPTMGERWLEFVGAANSRPRDGEPVPYEEWAGERKPPQTDERKPHIRQPLRAATFSPGRRLLSPGPARYRSFVNAAFGLLFFARSPRRQCAPGWATGSIWEDQGSPLRIGIGGRVGAIWTNKCRKDCTLWEMCLANFTKNHREICAERRCMEKVCKSLESRSQIVRKNLVFIV